MDIAIVQRINRFMVVFDNVWSTLSQGRTQDQNYREGRAVAVQVVTFQHGRGE